VRPGSLMERIIRELRHRESQDERVSIIAPKKPTHILPNGVGTGCLG